MCVIAVVHRHDSYHYFALHDPLIAHTFQVIYLYVGQRYHQDKDYLLSLIHISEPTRQEAISYAVFCLKKKK